MNMSRYATEHYFNRREYLDWLAEVYGVDRADVVLLSSILGTDQDFDGLPAALAGLPTVCQYLGLDTGDYSFGYIAGWSSGKEQKELRSSLECIRNTAAELIDGIERQCLELPPPEPVFQRRRKQTSKRTTKPQTR